MSSVGGASDRSMAEEQIRRMRETTAAREADQAKQQNTKIRNLNETHQAELEEVKDDHSKALDHAREQSRETLSRRDMKYQKDVESLREMHVKALQRQVTDADSVKAEMKKTSKAEMNRVETTSDQQKEMLTKNFENELRHKDSELEDFANTSRNKQSDAADRLKKNLNDRHEEDTLALVKDRDDRVLELQNRVTEIRHEKTEAIRDLEAKKGEGEERLIHNSNLALEHEQKTNAANLQENRKDLKTGLDRLRERYERASTSNRQNLEDTRAELTKDLKARVGTKLQATSDDYERLKAEQPRIEMRSKREKARELSDLRDNMQANIESLETARKGTVEASNAKNKTEIEQILKKDEGTLHESNRYYQDKLATLAQSAQEKSVNGDQDASRLLNQEKTTSNTRFNKLKSFNDAEQSKLRDYFDRASDSLRENYDVALRDMRARNQNEQQALFASFSKRSQENDAKFQTAMGDQSAHYEQKIADIQDSHQKELRETQISLTRQKNDVVKKSEGEIKTQASQYEYRIAKIEESHAKQLDDLKRKHEETLAIMTKTRQA